MEFSVWLAVFSAVHCFCDIGGACFPEKKLFSQGGGALFFRDITEAFRDITEAFV